MFRILAILIGTFSGILIVFFMLALFQLLFEKNKVTVGHKLGTYIYTFFVVAILVATGVPSFDSIHVDATISYVPFHNIIGNFIQYLLNLILFVPFGFLLPTLWSKYQTSKRTIFAGFVFSLLIEISQLFCYRMTDIDDLIMNTLGTALGFMLFTILSKKKPGLIKKVCLMEDISHDRIIKLEEYIIFGMIILVMFFIQPLIANKIWSIVLRRLKV